MTLKTTMDVDCLIARVFSSSNAPRLSGGPEPSAEAQDLVKALQDTVPQLRSVMEKAVRGFRFRTLDIVSDLGGSDVFIIDGDALLIECLCDARLDLGRAQALHVAYLVESLLSNMQIRSCKFELVFFDCNRSLYGSDAFLQLCRMSLVTHLQHRTSYSVTRLPSWYEHDWFEHLATVQPAFVLVGCRGPASTAWMADVLPLVMYAEALVCMARRQQAATMDGLAFVDSKVLAGAMTASHASMEPQQIDRIIELSKSLLTQLGGAYEQSVARWSVGIERIVPLAGKASLLSRMRLRVTALALSHCLATESDHNTAEFSKIFLLHTLLLDRLSLGDRSLRPSVPWRPAVAALHRILRSMVAVQQLAPIEHGEFDLADFADGSYFVQLATLAFAAGGAVSAEHVGIPDDLARTAEEIWQTVINTGTSSLFPLNMSSEGSSSAQAHLKKNPVPKEPGSHLNLSPLIGLENPLVDEYLADLNSILPAISLQQASQTGLITTGDYYSETYHWHSGKLIDEENASKVRVSELSDWQRKKHLREKQKAALWLRGDIESQEGGFCVTTRSLTVVKANQKDVSKPKKSGKQAKEGGKAKQIKEENALRIATEERAQDMTKLRKVVEDALTLPHDAQLSYIMLHFKTSEYVEVFLEEQSIRLAYYLEVWQVKYAQAKRAPTTPKPHDFFARAAQIVEAAQSMFLRAVAEPKAVEASSSAKSALRKALSALCAIGLVDTAHRMALSLFPGSSRNEKIKKASPTHPVEFSDVRFQMIHFGHLMQRDVDAAPDPRVPQFKPDKWQRELLDVVDNRESALVCAPTSAGKTFISYYAMETVLRESDSGVIVYVSPTKALVNQVNTQVKKYFGNKHYEHPGYSVSGVYTRDYRTDNFLSCQILVTVPEILEILLLSPLHNAEGKWGSRIKYVIFDEVHCIGDMDGGEVWEHLLLLTACPFIALSATIGNPVEFHQWLQKAQGLRGHNVRLVQHAKRWSDLQKHVFFAEDKVDSGSALNDGRPPSGVAIKLLHPASVLQAALLKNQGITTDLAFTPGDCIELFDAMKAVADAAPDGKLAESLRGLDPDQREAFRMRPFISKRDAREYELLLKDVLLSWFRANRSSAEQVIERLGADIAASFNALEAKHGPMYPYKKEFLVDHIMALLKSLEVQDRLPAIVFNFDRTTCDRLLGEVVRSLTDSQNALRDSAEWKNRLAALQAKVAREHRAWEEEMQRREAVPPRDKANLGPAPPEPLRSYRVPRIEPGMTFVPVNSTLAEDEFEELIERLIQKNPRLKTEGFIDGLRRGIGVHHSGMPKKYRQAVEKLFRMKHIRVVIATGTLALGINMPCRTTVFAGDSVYLNALQFRQMSGRAGRRGYDPLGHVVFFGIPLPKIGRLLSSELTKLHGHFPLTTTLVLRLMLLHTQSEKPEFIKKTILSLLQQPLFCIGREHLAGQMKHHVWFSLEFLLREGLLDGHGRLRGMAGIVSHLYYTEPANYALHVLLKTGVFHRIMAGSGSHQNKLREIVVIVANLFNRERLYPGITRGEAVSKVFLEALPADASSVLEAYNRRTLDVFTLYVVTFARHAHLALESSLPVSKFALPSSSMKVPAASVLGQLGQRRLQYVTRSPFVALGGHGDHYHSVDELIRTVCPGIHIDGKAIPLMKLRNSNDERLHWNRYIVDFYEHGQLGQIVKHNRIRSGDAWQLLHDTMLLMMSVGTGLQKRDAAMPPDALGQQVTAAFKEIAAEFEQKVNDAGY
eukprot:TRINITY_DN30896_c0_g1_i1.p1 TRINITY_DN30896_c0_g1~~TRINITY_DN30896_c0_g1_i1.p1  ORF type:complete len:1741 (-),score=432.81 TRINITY_DN30896_c0_g1_i1:116-5338(-)